MTQKMSETDVDSIKRQNAEYAVALARRDEKIRSLNLAIQTLETQLYQERTMRAALKRLYQGVDRRILGSIQKKGAKKVDAARAHPALRPTKSNDYHDLIVTARIYDIEEFFIKNRPKNRRDLRFPYYVIAESYIGIRDLGIGIVKKVYKQRFIK